MSRPPPVKHRIADYLRDRVGEKVSARELRQVTKPGVAYQRGIRELRSEGWRIDTNRDDAGLAPGEYRLAAAPPDLPVKMPHAISNRLRAEILEGNELACRACGLAAGDRYPDTGRGVVLHIAYIQDRAHGGKDELDNLRAYCDRCNDGFKQLRLEPPTWTWLLGQIRKAKQDDQRKAYEWLKTKFEGQ